MSRTLGDIAATIASAVFITGSQAAASVQTPPAAQPATTTGVNTTSGHGWKLTDWLGVYAASPSKTYTITFD
ncbi:hypothetical protein KBZ21_37395, partial [Streptomyces sp. A73]|nr:hypothetical protein [Streptomyces sp. A73]